MTLYLTHSKLGSKIFWLTERQKQSHGAGGCEKNEFVVKNTPSVISPLRCLLAREVCRPDFVFGERGRGDGYTKNPSKTKKVEKKGDFFLDSYRKIQSAPFFFFFFFVFRCFWERGSVIFFELPLPILAQQKYRDVPKTNLGTAATSPSGLRLLMVAEEHGPKRAPPPLKAELCLCHGLARVGRMRI